MEIFKNLSELLGDGQQLSITLRKSGQELVASVMPGVTGVKDKAVENIVPIVINGLPEEFDEGFVDAVKQGLPQAFELVSNIKEYEESVSNARKATEMAKKAKDEKDKQKKEFDAYIDLARQNLKEDKFLDAKRCIQKASAIPNADKALIDKALKAIDERSGAGSIFGGPIDKSDGKNIVPGKTPAKTAAPAQASSETNKAFEEAMELSDEPEEADESESNENEEEE